MTLSKGKTNRNLEREGKGKNTSKRQRMDQLTERKRDDMAEG